MTDPLPRTKRKIAIMMPYGGDDRVKTHRSEIDFLRLKYLLQQKIDVPDPALPETTYKVDYEVHRVVAGGEQIAASGLALIKDADILIGLLTDQNANVIFEISLRCILRDIPVLIVREELKNPLPAYLADIEYYNFTNGDKDPIELQSQIAANDLPLTVDIVKDSAPPANVKEAIDRGDVLKPNLERALRQREMEQPPKMLGWVTQLFGDLHPDNLLATWETDYYPYSIVMQRWKKRSGDTEYAPSDQDGPAVVVNCNHRFLNLYNIDEKTARSVALTLEELLKRLYNEKRPPDRQLVTEENFVAFAKDQAEMTDAIVMRGESARHGSVPLALTDRHPDERFKGKKFLPGLVAKKIVGDTSRPHRMYLFVLYVELPIAGVAFAKDKSDELGRPSKP